MQTSAFAVQFLLEPCEMIGDETVRVGAQLHGGPRLETLVGGDVYKRQV